MVTVEQVMELKSKIKAEMLRRNGHGSLAEYSNLEFLEAPIKNELIKADHGQKTVDLVLKIEDYGDLTLSERGILIPSDFSEDLLIEVDRLATETKTGESEHTVSTLFPDRVVETSSCRGDCTGLCVDSCYGLCNGCTGCTASCGTGCASGCNTTCNTGCSTGCQGSCTGDCQGTCNTTCQGGCNTACTGATAQAK